MAALTLAEALADLPDPRSCHGRFHPLPAVLGRVVLGLLMGRTALAGISRRGRLHGAPLAWALGFRRGTTPTKSMPSELLRALDATALEAALSRWGRSRPAGEPDQVSLDGKTLKGSRAGAGPGQHLVAASAPQAQAVLAQVRVDAKTNEPKAALQLLGLLPLEGKVGVGGALFCQRDVAEQVVAAGADYLFVVKDNQPGLPTDIAAGCGFAAAARSTAAAGSPRRAATSAGARRHDRRHGPRPRGEAHAAHHPDPHAAGALGGIGSGL